MSTKAKEKIPELDDDEFVTILAAGVDDVSLASLKISERAKANHPARWENDELSPERCLQRFAYHSMMRQFFEDKLATGRK
ncbi:hypothetical protein [Rhizobium sp. 007]|uniref:hypothetical protein n=1 Tax=Rhizobium sp. 007 TaxID=2785056 RepID=UPI00188F5E8A|nr:hypothetical protein [Rhizobium sp. 007]QPB21122.1 hypothetical protein ISN39_06545 [Rhizobium sp. 007]